MEQISVKVKETFNLYFPKGRVDFVLKEPFYCGLNKHKDKIYPHKYQTIITKELFDHVQNIKASFHKKPFKFAGLPYLYRGLIRCGVCDCMFTPEKKKGKYVYYHCTEYHGKCNPKWLREEEITRQLSQYFEKIHIPDEVAEGIAKVLKESHTGKVDFYNGISDGFKAQYDLLQKRIEKMYVDKLDGSITEDFYNKKLLEFRAEQTNIQTKLNNLQKTDTEYYTTGMFLLKLANRATDIFKRSEPEVKRQLIKIVLQNPIINDATLDATIRNPFSIFAERASCHSWLPVRRNRPRFGVKTIRGNQYLREIKKRRDLKLIRLELLEGRMNCGILIRRILKLDHNQWQAVHKQDNVRTSIMVILDNSELINGKKLILRRMGKIKKPNLIRNYPIIPPIFHVNAIDQHGVKPFIINNQIWAFNAKKLFDCLLLTISRNLGIDPINRITKTTNKDHISVALPLGIRTVKRNIWPVDYPVPLSGENV